MLYGYDGVGRLTLAAMSAGGTAGAQSYAYTAGTNRLASTTDSAGTRTIAYDGRGNTASEARPGSVSVTADYDGYGRLVGYDRSGAGAQSYGYNGLDDRVAMATAAGARRFVYDSDGRVLGEYGASADDVKAEFVWAVPRVAGGDGPFGGADGVGGYAPLAVATPDAGGAIQINWVHGNHLGVPLVTTDSAGNLAATPSDYLLPGFPGQSQVFADLYYNRYRDYDSATGRYIQADPIGLAGGSNPYLYAEGNPINLTDPTGEFVPILAGIAIGVGIELGGQALSNLLNGRNVFDWRCYEWGEVALAGVTGAFGGAWVKGWLRMTPGSWKWKNVSDRIRPKEGLVGEQVDIHHWLVPKRMGDRTGGLRDRIINHPWNLNPLPRRLHHEIHQGPIWRLLEGVPRPVLGAGASGAAATAEELGDDN